MNHETRGAAEPCTALSVDIECAQPVQWNAICACAGAQDAAGFARNVLQGAATLLFSERQASTLRDPQARLSERMRAAKSFGVSVLLTDDAQMRDLNSRFRQLDKPTNVLAFPALTLEAGPDGGWFLGDIALGHEILCREAAQQGKSADAHLAHLLVHGLLHLLGFDHDIDAEAAIMESHERHVLARLGYEDPYDDHEGDPHNLELTPFGTMSQKGPVDEQ